MTEEFDTSLVDAVSEFLEGEVDRDHPRADAERLLRKINERYPAVGRVFKKNDDKPQKKIAILGTTMSRLQAPINDDSWEIWTIGPGAMDNHRWDRLYETHGVWPEDFDWYLNKLSNIKPPQIVRTIHPMKTRARVWALAQHHKDEAWLDSKIKGNWEANSVIDREYYFTRYGRMWFSTTICYALADAIEEGADIIGLWGIDLESDEEHLAQQVGARFFIDHARNIGIVMDIPEASGLMRDWAPYPDRYESYLALALEKKLKALREAVNRMELDAAGARMMMHRTEGRLLQLQHIKQDPTVLSKQDELAEALNKELQKHQGDAAQLQARVNHVKGERNAGEWIYQHTSWGMRNSHDPEFPDDLTV